MMYHFDRYHNMKPAYKDIREYNDGFTSLLEAQKKSETLKQAKVAMAWGVPDNESLGMSQRQLVDLISKLVKIIEAS